MAITECGAVTLSARLRRREVPAAEVMAAGAILIGETNVPEFGLGSHMANPVFGPIRNPHAPGLTPGGSCPSPTART